MNEMMQHMMGYSMSPAWGWVMMLFMIVTWVLIIAVLVLAIIWLSKQIWK